MVAHQVACPVCEAGVRVHALLSGPEAVVFCPSAVSPTMTRSYFVLGRIERLTSSIRERVTAIAPNLVMSAAGSRPVLRNQCPGCQIELPEQMLFRPDGIGMFDTPDKLLKGVEEVHCLGGIGVARAELYYHISASEWKSRKLRQRSFPTKEAVGVDPLGLQFGIEAIPLPKDGSIAGKSVLVSMVETSSDGLYDFSCSNASFNEGRLRVFSTTLNPRALPCPLPVDALMLMNYCVATGVGLDLNNVNYEREELLETTKDFSPLMVIVKGLLADIRTDRNRFTVSYRFAPPDPSTDYPIHLFVIEGAHAAAISKINRMLSDIWLPDAHPPIVCLFRQKGTVPGSRQRGKIAKLPASLLEPDQGSSR